jgi:AcrR family transcriptional regulator
MSPRNEEQNAVIKDERREQILAAALHVFASKGFAASKISDIVARGGMSHGLVYHYFKSKEEIFFELVKRALGASSQSLKQVAGMPLTPLEKVRYTAEFILGIIDNLQDSAYYFLIVIQALVMEGPDELKKLMYESNSAIETMARILAEGQQTGEIRLGDPLEMSVAFFAAIQGLAVYKLAMEDFKMPEPEILVNMVKSEKPQR